MHCFIFQRIRRVFLQCDCYCAERGGGEKCVSLPCLCMKAHVYARQRCRKLLFCLPISCSFCTSEPEGEKTKWEKKKEATFKMACFYLFALGILSWRGLIYVPGLHSGSMYETPAERNNSLDAPCEVGPHRSAIIITHK